MKVFICSVIRGFESHRDTAARVVKDFGYEVIRAEDFGAIATSPQEACLAGVRKADLTILLLGERYGEVQASSLSATHEEYREARGRQPVLPFVQEQVDYEAAQEKFIAEVQGWETGNLTVGFTTRDELRSAVTRALHNHAVSAASRSVDEHELLALAEAGVDDPSVSKFFGGEPKVVLSLAAGPRWEVLRPSQLEDEGFARELLQETLSRTHSLFAVDGEVSTKLRGGWLVVSQERVSVELNSAGDIVVRQTAVAADRGFFEVSALIEEEVCKSLARALHFSASVLDRIDSVKRLSHVAAVAASTEVRSLAWRTQEEHARRPNWVSIEVSEDRASVHLNPAVRTRAELSNRADELAHDFMFLLRRELKR